MLSPPDGFDEDLLAAELARGWRLTAASLSYLPRGFGSHHWDVTDTAGSRWFVTVDELEGKRHRAAEPLEPAFARLCAALAAAAGLRAHGLEFVLAPVPAGTGEPAVRFGDRFGLAVYPYLDGQYFGWGEFSSAGHRLGVLNMVIALHAAPAAAVRPAMTDDFTVPYRDELEAGLDPARVIEYGPYSRAAARLLAASEAPVRRLLGRYDELAAAARQRPGELVATHGEPHPGNTMLAAGRWMLVDWDTALLAPPERDLWRLDPGDGSALAAYQDATGRAPSPRLLELYRIRWDIADLAIDTSRFRRPHSGSADDEESFRILSGNLAQVSSQSGLAAEPGASA